MAPFFGMPQQARSSPVDDMRARLEASRASGGVLPHQRGAPRIPIPPVEELVPFVPFEPGQDDTYIRGGLSNAAYQGAQALGAPDVAARAAGKTTESLIDFVPFLGGGVGAEEAVRDFRSGDYLPGIIGGLATVAGSVIPGASKVGGALKSAVRGADAVTAPLSMSPKGIRAFHGSPHSFDKFDSSKIGTGEGIQAFGRGLYAAENEGVARSYRKLPGGMNFKYEFDDLYNKAKESGFSGDASYILTDNAMGGFGGSGIDGWFDGFEKLKNDAGQSQFNRQAAEELLNKKDEVRALFEEWKAPGSLYEVNINADPEDFLDWDRPMSEQSAKVKAAIDTDRFWNIQAPDGAKAYNPGNLTEAEAKEYIENFQQGYERSGGKGQWKIVKDDPTGAEIARGMEDRLKEAGIPGIKYLDQGSRVAGEGSRNYVVFDDSLIDIVRKYGIAAAIGAGLLTQADADQMLAQGDLEG